MFFRFHKYIVKKWMLMRMAAMEFGFKQPFNVNEEYPILKSILILTLFPIEMIFVFWYARMYGSLRAYTFQLIFIFFIINFLISMLIINPLKNDSEIQETINLYDQLDYDSRKKYNSFKNIASLAFFMAVLPWMICGIAIAIICIKIPLYSYC